MLFSTGTTNQIEMVLPATKLLSALFALLLFENNNAEPHSTA